MDASDLSSQSASPGCGDQEADHKGHAVYGHLQNGEKPNGYKEPKSDVCEDIGNDPLLGLLYRSLDGPDAPPGKDGNNAKVSQAKRTSVNLEPSGPPRSG